ncbi:sugar kinase [Microbacterium sp. SORGH_AS_0888]|uniref:sugar kinase n=1 Tax=Microbacterium sp. SORGH_AS_0888 TaxID=3041791 RepID=UPI002780E0E0|nr:sugar kinase [Microbacterium sp. SORGH_AS_0888]MDQ1129700.1 2-dehydro-3-deoxygluconokinase [Microbacterium sp. SORGH_AS_0888]
MTGAPRVVTLGETMGLVRATEIGSLTHVSALALGIGGAESNVAVGLSRLGVRTSWLGRVGDDPLGVRVVRELRAEGVEVRSLVDAGAPTGLMLKERPSATATAVHYYRAGSAGSCLSPSDLPDGWVESADLLHVTGITPLLSPSARSTVIAAVDRAAVSGVPVSFDVNYRSALAGREAAGPILREIAERAHLVFGGADELALLFPDDDAPAAARLHAAGVAHVVTKLGADGAELSSGGTTVRHAAFAVTPLDTVGAGDAFVAGYLSAWLEGLDAEASLRRANATGAMACLVPGDWEAAPTRRDLARFLGGDDDPVRR